MLLVIRRLQRQKGFNRNLRGGPLGMRGGDRSRGTSLPLVKDLLKLILD
jgi:hypothetical protein